MPTKRTRKAPARKPSVRKASTTRTAAVAETVAADPIEHVIVLMLENRSFDHYLGAYQKLNPKIDGIPPTGQPRTNSDSRGNKFPQAPSQVPTTPRDIPHESADVLPSIANNNDGFIRAYEERYRSLNPPPTPQDYGQVMAYFPVGSLPAIDVLARNFLVCDRWFASVPGPTWTNRFFAHSGTSIGRVLMPEGILRPNLRVYNQETIYDRLNLRKVGNKRAPISWKIYYGDVPQSLLLTHQLTNLDNLWRYNKMSNFFKDAKGPAKNFPQYAFIEPSFFGSGQNDDHPSVDVMRGQMLIADVYNAIRANAALWKSTLLILVYDEHGGFYDHVSPPPATPPDHKTNEYTFDRYGVRVPAVLISPWVQAGVLSELFDHTSLLRYVADKWQLDVAKLGKRVAGARSFAGAIRGPLRNDTPKRIEMPEMAAVRAKASAGAPSEPLTDFQQSLVAFTEMLERETPDTPRAKVRRYEMVQEGPAAQEQVALERVDRFFALKTGRPMKKAPSKKAPSKKAAAGKKSPPTRASSRKTSAGKTGAKKKR